MDREKIFVARKMPEAGLNKLFQVFDVEVSPHDRNLTGKEITEMAADAQGLVSMPTNTIDRALINALPGIRIIANYAVGYNNIDAEYAKEKDIVVTNTPGVLTEATADIAMGLILSVARRIVEGDKAFS